jgi:hypothetical protein
MKMAKKFALIVVASAFFAGTLSGCGGEKAPEKAPDATKAPEKAPEPPKAPEGK